MTALPIDPDLAALIAEQAIDLFLENRDVHGHDEARAKREAVAGVAEGASTPEPILPWHVRVSRVLDGFTYQTMYVHRFVLDDAPRVRACVAQVREQALGHWEEHYGGEHGRVRFHFEWSPDIPDAVVLTAIVPPLGAAVCDPAPKREGGNA